MGVVKARLAAATSCRALLKKKSDALTVQFRAILKHIVAAKEAMGDAIRGVSLSLAEALYVAGGPLRHVVQQSVGHVRLRVRAHRDNIAGVRLPRFEPGRRQRLLNDVARRARRRRAAGVRLPRGARPRRGGAGGAGVAADVVPDAGRGDQDDQPAGERAGERGEAAAREHHRLHQGRARRAGEGGVLPPQEDPGQQAARTRAADGVHQALRRG